MKKGISDERELERRVTGEKMERRGKGKMMERGQLNETKQWVKRRNIEQQGKSRKNKRYIMGE